MHFLQAHEDGQVVLFCGAGISYPAGLPGFNGLVTGLQAELNVRKTNELGGALELKRYDTALALMERDMPEGRRVLRRSIYRELQPNLRREGAVDTHQALLELGRDREGRLRLVTTNFDRIFDSAKRRLGVGQADHIAPMLPIPKASQWNGLVYLHGKLPTNEKNETELDRLIVTSGDFGRAYLTDGWAARFMTELLRNFVVCFVGYSLEDPILRYMMDALAADEMRGEKVRRAYAFGAYKPGEREQQERAWSAKFVTPLLYPTNADETDHTALQAMLKDWSELYRDGITGKQQIVVQQAGGLPQLSAGGSDDPIEEMLWALSDPSGKPAMTFADHDPTPPLEWLEVFASNRFGSEDLLWFGVAESVETSGDFAFSLIDRPASFLLSPNMKLIAHESQSTQWDEVMFQVVRWLMRHLNNPQLLLSCAKWEMDPHSRLAEEIKRHLNQIDDWQVKGNQEELDGLSEKSPDAIPSVEMRRLWEILLSGRAARRRNGQDLRGWWERAQALGLTPTLVWELRQILTPRVRFSAPLDWDEDDQAADDTSISALVDFYIVFQDDFPHSLFDHRKAQQWQRWLPELIDTFEQLLRECLDLRRELDDASDDQDYSCMYLPSLNQQQHDRPLRDWTVLIILLRDAWLAYLEADPEAAARRAEAWFDIPYPTFKRLAFFAAAKSLRIENGAWIAWLQAQNGRWLWTVETGEEATLLLAERGARLPEQIRKSLEDLILRGPPKGMYEKTDSDAEVLHALVMLETHGATLSDRASKAMARLRKAMPQPVAIRQNSAQKLSEQVPSKPGELAKWLRAAKGREDKIDRWRTALRTWHADDQARRAWQVLAHDLASLSDEDLLSLGHSLSRWLKGAAKGIKAHKTVMLNLCQRVLDLPYDDPHEIHETGYSPDTSVSQAINHPIGHVTEALIHLWLSSKPKIGKGIAGRYKVVFTRLCDVSDIRFRFARVILASRVITLFHVDPTWTEKHLRPQFDWEGVAESPVSMWQGLLWSPYLHRGFMSSFKKPFLDTAAHHNELGESGRNYARLLTFLALNGHEEITTEDLRSAFAELSVDGLADAVRALQDGMSNAGDHLDNYWSGRVVPFWKTIWPNVQELKTHQVSEAIAYLITATDSKFPDAVKLFENWLQCLESPGLITHPLSKTALCTHYPGDALTFLDKIIGPNARLLGNIGNCLTDIIAADSRLKNDPRYQRLSGQI